MIIGHGIDLVDTKRFKAMSPERLLKLANKICVESELLEFRGTNSSYKYLAKIWAAKEAVSKAFGTGIDSTKIWRKIKIGSNTLGRPVVYLKEPYSEVICHLSISHDKEYVIASVILEKYV